VGLVAALALVRAGPGAVRRLDAVAVAGSALAWGLEAVVVWQAAAWTGIDLSPAGALLVTTVSVAAQVAAIAPGGLGTYEAAAVAAYATLGVAPGTALAAAVVAHGVTTAYSLGVGAVAVVAPAPGLLGRLRLARGAAAGGAAGGALGRPGAPIVLFLPARDEGPRVAGVVRRAPGQVGGHPVQVVVVDDGSTDATAAEATAAGAEVVRATAPGLGATVRQGLAEGVARGAVAVAFCDADGEYDPAQLERLVGPILDGHADYVVGSRLADGGSGMRAHRRLGNAVLTRALAFVARAPITDGQSGFRALAPAAAAAAEVIHDFNYAQVLTLDLLAKGFRYAEAPISYRFRTSGRSYIRLTPYLRHVVPAVWRELNAA
ncbi:MAG: glycosyltransferase, partial [Acidimicrobiales bacterium]